MTLSLWSANRCGELVYYMKNGYSFHGACGCMGISVQTGYNWLNQYPEFKAAKEEGEAYSLSFLEKCALADLTGIIPPSLQADGAKRISTTMAIFLLKTRFHKIYGDKVSVDSGDDNPFTVTLNYQKPSAKKPDVIE